MLQTLRDKTSGWIATVILGLLIIPFALVGVQDYVQRSAQQPVATIGVPPSWWPSAPSWWPVSVFWEQEEIGQDEFLERLEQVRQQERERLGDAFDARAFESPENKREVLESLVDERVQLLWAREHGLVVSDAMVRDAIAEIPAFQVDGRFNLQRYRLVLASSQPARTEAQFEALVRADLQQRLLAAAVSRSNFVTDSEFNRLIELLGERRDVSALEIPAPPTDTAPVTPEQLEAAYRANQDDYRAPETVELEYVVLDAANLPAPAVDEAVLRQRYEQDKARYSGQEQRVASHILIEVPEGAPAAQVEAARARAAALAQQARAGGDFAALARANSDDIGSREAGGDLGAVGRGVMTGAFEDALFAMQAGQISEPVRTEFGWHVIQLREVQAGQQQGFEQAREALAAEFVESERERAFTELSTRVVDAVLKNPTSLAPAAREAGLQVQRSGPIARGQGQGLLASPEVQRAAFSESAIQDGMVSDPIEVGPNRSVVLRVASHTPARARPLAEVRAQVEAAVRAERQRLAAQQRVDAIVKRLRAGESLAQVATAENLAQPSTLPGVPRGAPLVAEGVSEAIFAISPDEAGVMAGSHVLDDGRAAVFVVDRIIPGALADVPEAQRASLRQQIAEMRGLSDVAAMLRAMRRGMRIEIIEANL